MQRNFGGDAANSSQAVPGAAVAVPPAVAPPSKGGSRALKPSTQLHAAIQPVSRKRGLDSILAEIVECVSYLTHTYHPTH